MFKKFKTFIMQFKETMRDEEGNVKYDKNGAPVYIKKQFVVKHNPYYIVK